MVDSVSAGVRPTCFIAMPVATRPSEAEKYGDGSHWLHVMDGLFAPAIEAAGFQVLRPVAEGSHLIHGLIIKHLSTADLVLCDLSSHNPNVFFELGVRTSLNLPIALVRDEGTELPFDTSGINTHQYSSDLRGWEIESGRQALASHISQSVDRCAGANPLWRQFGLKIRAQEPDAHESPLEAKVDLLTDRLSRLQRQMEHSRHEDLDAIQVVELDGGRETWLGHRESYDGSRLFSEAFSRFATKRHLAAELVRRSDGSFDVRLPPEAGVGDFNRVIELGERYGVRVMVRTSS